MAGCATVPVNIKDKEIISKEKALEIANKKAKELEYDLEIMEIYIDEKNSKWNEYVNILEKHPGDKEIFSDIFNSLEGKNYWAIWYYPVPKQKPGYKIVRFGGDLTVFVDKNTGEVINYLRGQ